MAGKVKPGQEIELTAAFYNACYDLVKRKPRTTSGGEIIGGQDPTLCRVRNDMTADLPLFGVVGLGVPLIDYTTYLDGYLESFAFSAVAAANDTYQYKWGLTIEPIPMGKIGWVRVSGLAHCFITPVDGRPVEFAGPDSLGSTDALISANCGARVIYMASGLNPKRGIVVL